MAGSWNEFDRSGFLQAALRPVDERAGVEIRDDESEAGAGEAEVDQACDLLLGPPSGHHGFQREYWRRFNSIDAACRGIVPQPPMAFL